MLRHEEQAPNTKEDFSPMIKTASLFSQLLHEFPRLDFQYLIKKHDAEKGAKGFTCWMQFVAMLFCHLSHADSLREICNGLSCCTGKLNHLGIESAPSDPLWPMPTSIVPLNFFKTSSGICWIASASKEFWECGKEFFVSRTSC